MKEQQKKQYSGTLTDGCKKRLTRAIDILCQTIKVQEFYSPVAMRVIKHKLSFITLTISSGTNITAKEAYHKAFKHFLQWLRRTEKVTTYVWKCEVQQRGQIHYHITTPSYIHYQSIRDKWNNLQRQNGWLEEYATKHGHYDPNSTDIHAIKKVRNLSTYLIKEFIKAIQNPQTDGKVWDCSANLKKYQYYRLVETHDINDRLNTLIDEKKVDVIDLERCTVIKLKKRDVSEIISLRQLQQYEDFLTMIRNYRKDT